MRLNHLLRKFFGVEQELEALRSQLAELSWDVPFGMWTRPAFLRLCQQIEPGLRPVAFIDLNDIGDLNLRYGYTEIDHRIKQLFARLGELSQCTLVGRWYSGDEIVIVFSQGEGNAFQTLFRLEEYAQQFFGMSFYYELGEWTAGDQPITAVIEALSNRTCNRKAIERAFFPEGDVQDGDRNFSARPADRAVNPQIL
jgi:GGDEF domain-containing protein